MFSSLGETAISISSPMDDPRLHHLRIGVHITGDQDSNLPPVNALLSRGIVRNLVGYSIYGKLSEKNPPSDLIQAVAQQRCRRGDRLGADGRILCPTHLGAALRDSGRCCFARSKNSVYICHLHGRAGAEIRALQQQLNVEIQRREPEIRQYCWNLTVCPLLDAPPTVRVGY